MYTIFGLETMEVYTIFGSESLEGVYYFRTHYPRRRFGGFGGAKPTSPQGGLGGRRPPNVRCGKFSVRVYVPIKLLNILVTILSSGYRGAEIFLHLGYDLRSVCRVTFFWLRLGYYPLAIPIQKV